MSSITKKRVEATIMFCDIMNFTTLFDDKDPEEAFVFANYVLKTLSNVVTKCGGTVDKFMGDGLLAHFGVNSPNSDHAMKACYCSLKLLDEIWKINCNRYILNQIIISLGIGIHSGEIVFGKIEAGTYNEFSVFGDVVNTASRIERMTRFFSVDILVSQTTYDLCKNNLDFFKIGDTTLKGKKGKHTLFWLVPTNLIKNKL
ncbi:adenylate/guanylate cyclase domain-containing protein [Fluviispira vulneris]|uniref:adenylate/guanylate cyclase domain-containing protein n=1 Tax=Fluviispira vulneris TaxID=2763012 RepID=UPI0016487ACF|nr:adenylate/guanylate cyclase domain-containing protein [Fluviispira vulneris]